MKVIVTGASGHIGANLVRSLLEQGQAVRALVHSDRRALAGLQVECVSGDINDFTSLRRAFSGVEVVYHLASYVSIQTDEWAKLESTNIAGTRQVIAACRASGVRRLVHFSSIHALQKEPLDQPLDEDRPLVDAHSHSPYDRSKALSEHLVLKAIAEGLDAVILYPTAVIGPNDFKPSHMGQVLLAHAHHRLPALVTGGFDWVDARDVAAGAINAANLAPAGARYLFSGHWVSVRDLAQYVSTFTGVPAPLFVFPLELAKLAAPFATMLMRRTGQRALFTSVSLEVLDSHHHISHERATQDLGFQPRPFEQTIADTLRWFIDSGQFTPRPSR
jgi:dihydroflavonol-4-reductase